MPPCVSNSVALSAEKYSSAGRDISKVVVEHIRFIAPMSAERNRNDVRGSLGFAATVGRLLSVIRVSSMFRTENSVIGNVGMHQDGGDGNGECSRIFYYPIVSLMLKPDAGCIRGVKGRMTTITALWKSTQSLLECIRFLPGFFLRTLKPLAKVGKSMFATLAISNGALTPIISSSLPRNLTPRMQSEKVGIIARRKHTVNAVIHCLGPIY